VVRRVSFQAAGVRNITFGSQIRHCLYSGRKSLLWRSMFRRHFPWFLRSFVSSRFLPFLRRYCAGTEPHPGCECLDVRCVLRRVPECAARGLAATPQARRLENLDCALAHGRSETRDAGPHPLGCRKKIASIRVLDASDYRLACPDALNDMELTVVHELVHWFFHRCRVPSRRTAAPRSIPSTRSQRPCWSWIGRAARPRPDRRA